MMWDQRLNNFQVKIISLIEWKKGNHDSSLTIISNTLSITNFFEAYDTFAGDCIVQNNCPINWLLMDDVLVGPDTTLATNKPYSATHGLVEEETTQQFTHIHPLYKTDDATVYDDLVIATLISKYASTISPFKIEKNVRGEINASKTQFYGTAH